MRELSNLTNLSFLAGVFLEQRIMLWTDGVDVFRPRDFYWNSSGLSFNETYANWGVGEPNNSEGSEHCVSLAWWLGHKFNDQPCYATASFICEYHP